MSWKLRFSCCDVGDPCWPAAESRVPTSPQLCPGPQALCEPAGLRGLWVIAYHQGFGGMGFTVIVVIFSIAVI